MAYVAKTLKQWLTENPNHTEFRGTAAGVPLIYQASAGVAPTLAAEDWFVWDYAIALPDTTQSATNADITPTGRIARVLIPTVPDAPASSDIEVPLGTDSDVTIDALEGLNNAYQEAVTASKKFYLGSFLGIGNKSPVYAASVSWSKAFVINFPEPITSTISITPSLGDYNELVTITNVGG